MAWVLLAREQKVPRGNENVLAGCVMHGPSVSLGVDVAVGSLAVPIGARFHLEFDAILLWVSGAYGSISGVVVRLAQDGCIIPIFSQVGFAVLK